MLEGVVELAELIFTPPVTSREASGDVPSTFELKVIIPVPEL